MQRAEADAPGNPGRALRNAAAYLTPGARLHWYRIERVLGSGGFGVTYLARDTNLNRPVAIKEFFPRGLAVREATGTVTVPDAKARAQFTWGLDRFISEGRTLARFDHRGIVGVVAVFEDNDTAYLVMRLEQGEPLADLLTRRRALSEATTRHLLANVCDGLKAVHDGGYIHRDIKPANLLVREDQSAVLLDFGSARIAVGSQTRDLTSLVSPGYAPFEQYHSDGTRQGPWTDVYALGATAYRMLVGVTPPAAMDRSHAVVDGQPDPLVPLRNITTLDVSPGFAAAVDWALEFRPEDRPKDLVAWCSAWRGAPHITTPRPATAGSRAPDQPLTRPNPTLDAENFDTTVTDHIERRLFGRRSPRPRRRGRVAAALAAILAALLVGALLLAGWPLIEPDAAAPSTAPQDASGPPPGSGPFSAPLINETVQSSDIVTVHPGGPGDRAAEPVPAAPATTPPGGVR